MTSNDVRESITAWNATTTKYPRDSTIHDLFSEQARLRPEAQAVSDGSTSLSYEQLDRAANSLTCRLVEAGVRQGDRVGVLIPASVDAVIAILGTLKAGAAYVPLDPTYPDSRLATMCDRVEIGVIVTGDGLPGRLRARTGISVDRRGAVVDPPLVTKPAATDLAYAIFTSGSSGQPKAVAVPHRGAVRLVRGTNYITIDPSDTILSTTNLSFDVSCLEIFGALLNGARVVFIDTETLLSPDVLAARIAYEQATIMWLSAGVFHEVAPRRPDMFARLRYFVAGGDALNPNVVRMVSRHGPPQHFLNGYGPTENSVLSTAHEIEEVSEDAETVPIGKPISNSTAYVLRDDGELADIGEVGELCVGGDGVAAGYYDDPALTEQRFIPDPFATDSGARLYRTGDRARWSADGVLDYLGRLDRQVKIRGYRVELSEIENTLASHPQVSEAVVDVDERYPGERRVIAWVVPVEGSRTELAARSTRAAFEQRLRRHVRDRLPLFMVPAAVRAVERLPLNHSGKVDRAQLPDIDVGEGCVDDPPRTATEQTVASIWCELLGLPALGRGDDFFEFGGQSLQLTQVVAMLQDRIGTESSRGPELVRCLLSAPSLREFAARVDELTQPDIPETATSETDLWSEARLDPGLTCAASFVHNPLDPEAVLLTGATGFLGVFLIDRLIRDTRAKVYCLVRADDQHEALARIAASMRRYGLSFDDVRRRVVAVTGDLGKPRLGLGARFEDLAERVDLVVHNGSHVNFVYPYTQLRTTNVDGSREVIRFAMARRTKPVHYVSTIATIVGCGVAGQRYIAEDTPPGHPENISMGYPETKWVAERLFLQATERGLPVSIYRPYEITGTTGGGVWNTDTMMCALFKTIAETGIAPDVKLPLDFVPVDVAAGQLVHIATHERPRGHTYNLTNPNDARLGLLVDRLRERDYHVRQVSYAQWVEEMSEYTATNPVCPLAPFMPMFAGSANAGEITIKEMYFADTFPEFGRDNVERALTGSGIWCPPVDATMLDRYLDYFELSGFLSSTTVAA